MDNEEQTGLAKAVALMTAWNKDSEPYPLTATSLRNHLAESSGTDLEVVEELTDILAGMMSLAGLALRDLSRARGTTIAQILEGYGRRAAG
jgi:hypothetical protein